MEKEKGDMVYAKRPMTAMTVAPSQRARKYIDLSFLDCLRISLFRLNSIARRLTYPMYRRMPVEIESKTPSTSKDVLELELYVLDTPMPIAAPTGVVNEKIRARM